MFCFFPHHSVTPPFSPCGKLPLRSLLFPWEFAHIRPRPPRKKNKWPQTLNDPWTKNNPYKEKRSPNRECGQLSRQTIPDPVPGSKSTASHTWHRAESPSTALTSHCPVIRLNVVRPTLLPKKQNGMFTSFWLSQFWTNCGRLGPDAEGFCGKNRISFDLCVLRSTRAGCTLGNSKACARATPLPHGQTEPTKASDLDIYNDNDKRRRRRQWQDDVADDDKNDKKDDNDDDNNDDIRHEQQRRRHRHRHRPRRRRKPEKIKMQKTNNSCNCHPADVFPWQHFSGCTEQMWRTFLTEYTLVITQYANFSATNYVSSHLEKRAPEPRCTQRWHRNASAWRKWRWLPTERPAHRRDHTLAHDQHLGATILGPPRSTRKFGIGSLESTRPSCSALLLRFNRYCAWLVFACGPAQAAFSDLIWSGLNGLATSCKTTSSGNHSRSVPDMGWHTSASMSSTEERVLSRPTLSTLHRLRCPPVPRSRTKKKLDLPNLPLSDNWLASGFRSLQASPKWDKEHHKTQQVDQIRKKKKKTLQ